MGDLSEKKILFLELRKGWRCRGTDNLDVFCECFLFDITVAGTKENPVGSYILGFIKSVGFIGGAYRCYWFRYI